jgi:hypothetical protein
MTTFFVEGCSTDSEMAFQYFEKINNPIEDVYKLDEDLQFVLKSFIEEDDNSESGILTNHSEVLSTFRKNVMNLKENSNKNYLKIEKIEVINGEMNLKKSALHLLKTYTDVAENELISLIKLLEIPDIAYTDDDDKELNRIIKVYNEKLNNAEKLYFMEVLTFSEKYQLDIDVEK